MTASASVDDTGAGFDAFARTVGERVRRGLVAVYGVELGSEAAADAMRYAWEHWDRLSAMDSPSGEELDIDVIAETIATTMSAEEWAAAP